MAAIGGASAIVGAYATGALVSTVAGSASKKSTSYSFGPAYLLAGVLGKKAKANYSSTLYNALGGLNSGAAAARAAYPSASNQERTAALKAAAQRIDAGDPAGGREDAQALLDKNPRDPAALAMIAKSYLNEQDYQQAERYYARALALVPSSTRLRGSLEVVRTLQKNDQEVLSLARKKLTGPSTRAEGLRLLFYLTERSPANVEAWLALADGFAAARKPLQVLGALQEALAAADQAQEYDQVISRARLFVAQYGQVGLGHNLLGRALIKVGRIDEGLRELKTGSQIAPDNLSYAEDLAAGYLERAAQSVAAGRLSSATTDLNAAFAIDPSSDRYREVAAKLALAQAARDIAGYRHSQAQGELNRAYSAAPDEATFKKRLAALFVRSARYYHNKGDESLALSNYTKAYELDSTSTLARRYMAELSYEAGLDYYDKSIYVTAIEHLERAHQAEPTNETYKQDLARAYHQRGLELERQDELTEAIEAYQKGFILDPANTQLGTDLSEAVIQRDAS